jgi:hypothetical protein
MGLGRWPILGLAPTARGGREAASILLGTTGFSALVHRLSTSLSWYPGGGWQPLPTVLHSNLTTFVSR